METFADGKREFNFSLSLLNLKTLKEVSITTVCYAKEKMKIISDYPELQGQVFKTVEECEIAESKVDEAKKQEGVRRSILEEEKAVVEAAHKKLIEARLAVDKAHEDADKIVNEARRQAAELVAPAHEACRKAQLEFNKALATYNAKHGPYRVVKTVNKDKEINDIIKILFGDI